MKFFYILLLILFIYNYNNVSAEKLSDKVLSDLAFVQKNKWPKVYKKSDIKKILQHIIDNHITTLESSYMLIEYKNGKFYQRIIHDYFFLPDYLWNGFNWLQSQISSKKILKLIQGRDYIEYLNLKIAKNLDNNKPFSFFILYSDVHYLKDFISPKYPIVYSSLKKNLAKDAILIPDPYLIQDTYTRELTAIKQNANIAFTKRKAIGFWRGTLTGLECHGICPREKLVWFSKENPQYLDARVIGCQDECKEINNTFGVDLRKYYVPMSDTTQYKYLISFDGNAAAWRRVPLILHSGSVLLYSTEFKQWFNPYIKNNIHYMTVRDDCSDLKEKIDFLRRNPKFAEKLTKNASLVANEILTPSFIDVFWTQTLKGIQDKFDNNQ